MNRDVLGSVLVVLQFGLMAMLGLLAAPEVVAGRATPAAWGFAAAGLALGMWALGCNRPGNFNIRPMPVARSRLIQSGPYRWVRHPMYSALMLCGLGCALTGESALPWFALAALVIVLAAKSIVEERWILVEHPDYASYRTRTWRFVPLLV